MIKELVTYIAEQTGLAIGTDIFANFSQEAQDDISVVMERTGGTPTGLSPDMGEVHIQVLTRAVDHDDAESQAWLIRNALHGQSGLFLPVLTSGDPQILVNVCRAIQDPGYLGIGENDRHEFSANYLIHKQVVS